MVKGRDNLWKATLLALIFLLFSLPISVPAGFAEPDLTVKEIKLSPEEPEPSDVVKITATIANQGRGDVWEDFYVCFKVDHELIGWYKIRRLRAGQEKDLESQWEAVQGTHWITVEVDRPFGRIEESDESNNLLEREITVRKAAGIQSITDELLTAIGGALKTTGEVLCFNSEESDPFKIIDEITEGLEEATEALNTAAVKLETIGDDLPRVLAETEQIIKSKAIGRAFRELAASFDAARESLSGFNIDGAVEALRDVKEGLVNLASLSFDRVDLSRLGKAASYVDEAIKAASELSASISSTEGRPAEEVSQDLLLSLTKAGNIISEVGTSIEWLAAESPLSFTNAQGTPVTEYRAGETLLINARGAQSIRVEIFDQAGNSLFNEEVQGEKFTWDGKDNTGKPLAVGTYFYRLTIETRGEEEIRIGRIIMS